jgi:uncharacterized protein
MLDSRSPDMQPEGTSAPEADLAIESMEPIVLSAGDSGQEPGLIVVEPEPAPTPKALPVKPEERVAGVDVLRGVALMGILAMNIIGFAAPEPSYGNPRAGGNTSTIDLVVWSINHVVFDEKMMTIFSMLFGAGLVLMTGRSDARGASLTGVYYRRVFWLLVIGLIHAYLIWWGDILVLYAECGFLLYLFRRRKPRTLIALGTLCLLWPVLIGTGVNDLYRMSQEYYWGIRGTPRVVLSTAGGALSQKFTPNPERAAKRFNEELEAYRGSYLGIVRHRAPMLIKAQTIEVAFVLLWFVGGRMLIGMGLMKLGVFSGERSRRFYLWMIGLGYGIGLPMIAYDIWLNISVDFKGPEIIQSQLLYTYVSALAIAMGHVGAVMLIFKSGALKWLTQRLAAAGRMALSNYLMQSLICTTLFYAESTPTGRDCSHDLGTPAVDEHHLAALLPLRTGRMGVALAHVLEAAADGCSAGFGGGDSRARGNCS